VGFAGTEVHEIDARAAKFLGFCNHSHRGRNFDALDPVRQE
jgi:hypothetical protein